MSIFWMVRAAEKGVYIDDFIEKGVVSLGGGSEGDLRLITSKKALFAKMQEVHSEWKRGKLSIWTGQLYRFAHEIAVNDYVVSYDPQQRLYHIGQVIEEYQFKEGAVGNHPHYRAVTWQGTVARDRLSNSTKNSLGAISSLFLIPVSAAEEMYALLKGERPSDSPFKETDTRKNGLNNGEILFEEELDEDESAEAAENKAIEFIKDKVNRLSWEEMQELVAGILRAMGYKTQVSPSGPDRGKDIIASPDGLGFENPRIIVEVKHREKSPMGAQAIRSFLGGRHPGDKGLYVSTGGFSKDALYEAERANIPLTLMNFDDLVKALVSNYEALDIEIKQLIPLKKIFWPV